MRLSDEFKKIHTQYEELNNKYTLSESQAVSKGKVKAYEKWRDKKQLNDAIHFLFAFSRFEDLIRTKSKELISRNLNRKSLFSQKSAWLILKEYEENDSLHLMKRVQLFIDKGDSRFAKIKEYYNTRNSLAHGGRYSTPIDVNAAMKNLLEYSKLLK